MRYILLGLSIAMTCGMTNAAGVVIDPKMTLGPLGLGAYQPEVFSSLPAVTLDVPLPFGVEEGLPTIQGNPEGGIDVDGVRSPSFPPLAGLSSMTALDDEVELPGLDGLPIRHAKQATTDAPAIPGFDGLPLGFGRQ